MHEQMIIRGAAARPLWVNSVASAMSASCPIYPKQQTSVW
jgi:hypothetical protein